MSEVKYCERGRTNPFDSYMAGCNMWHTPRQILLLERFLCDEKREMLEGIDAEAYEDMLSLIKHEAEIKRKKYL